MRDRFYSGCCALFLATSLAACGVASPDGEAGDEADHDSLTQGLTDLTCSGEAYDVNGDASDGCELVHAGANHTNLTATAVGSTSCSDGSVLGFSGRLLSDSRTHDPLPAAWSGAVGSAPDVYSVRATGGSFCVNDGVFTIRTTGGGATACYRFTVTTDKTSAQVTMNGQSTTTLSKGSNFYGSSSTVYMKLEKICNLPTQEAITYTVSFHL